MSRSLVPAISRPVSGRRGASPVELVVALAVLGGLGGAGHLDGDLASLRAFDLEATVEGGAIQASIVAEDDLGGETTPFITTLDGLQLSLTEGSGGWVTCRALGDTATHEIGHWIELAGWPTAGLESFAVDVDDSVEGVLAVYAEATSVPSAGARGVACVTTDATGRAWGELLVGGDDGYTVSIVEL